MPPQLNCPPTAVPPLQQRLDVCPWKGGVPWAAPPLLAERLLRLPPTLHIQEHTSTAGCSEAPRGLRFPVGVLGLCTQTPGSPDSGLGQWGPRYAIHAGRHLTGKGLRYLKTVRVTAAVHGSFTRLYPGFRYPHWAGVTGYAHPYGLAAGYVFVKQSGPPGY